MDGTLASSRRRSVRRWRPEGAAAVILVALCCFMGSIHGSDGKLVFLKRFHEVRVHEDAPAELYVTTVQAWNTNVSAISVNPTTPAAPWSSSSSFSSLSSSSTVSSTTFRERIKYTLLKGKEWFRVDEETGLVFTRYHLANFKLGHTFQLLVAAAAGGMSAASEILVHVTSLNRYKPLFRLADYRLEVARNLAPDEPVLTVDATDEDLEPYNAEIYYFLDGSNHRRADLDRHDALRPKLDRGTPPVIQFGCYEFDVWASGVGGNSSEFLPPADERCVAIDDGRVVTDADKTAPFFGIDARSGVLRLRRRLTRDLYRLSVRVVAVDGGSPPRWNVTTVDVHVKGTTQPTDIRVVNVTEFQARVCWQRPRYGVVLGYLVRYRTDAEMEFTLNVTLEAGAEAGADERPCVQLQQLHPDKRYELRVYGWNPEELGIASDFVHFTTLTPKCPSDNFCGNGTCLALVSQATAEPQLRYTCECDLGFYGADCRHLDPCALTNPCRNAGTCRNTSSGQYVCACVQGFSGPDCAEFNPCDSSSDFIRCENGGTCLSSVSHSYTCSCPAGFRGERCERLDPCGVEPCLHGGVCNNRSDDTYACSCPTGYVGKDCEVDVDHCASSPCVNGECMDHVLNFTCVCTPGFSGPLCADNVDECAVNPCLNEGHCTDGMNTFTCRCLAGFEGRLCEINVDECLSTPCYNGGSCSDDLAGFSCHCTSAFQGPTCQTPAMCQEENVTSAKGSLSFAATPHGSSTSDDCPFGPSGAEATRKCVIGSGGHVEWSDVNATECKDQAYMNAKNIAWKLKSMTADPSNLTAEKIEEATEEIENILNYSIQDKEIAIEMIGVMSKLMDANDTAFYPSQKSNHSAASRLIKVVERFVSEVVMEETFDIRTDNLAVHVDKVNLETLPPPKSSRQWNTTTALLENSIDENEDDDASYQMFPKITTPRSAMMPDSGSTFAYSMPQVAVSNRVLRKALSQCDENSKKTRRMHFVAYNNAKIFKETHDIAESSTTMDRLTPSKRLVLSISLENATISNVTNGVNFTMKKPMFGKWICVFWDENNVRGPRWSTRGVTTIQDDGQINCTSNHMTAFSVLVDPDPYAGVDAVHQKSLNIISYIGSGLSVIGLSLTILTYSLFRCLNRDKPGKILLNLCVAMLLLNIAFLIGSLRSSKLHETADLSSPTPSPSPEESTEPDALCTSVAIFTHYFLLATLSWMTVEAVNMYQLLIHVFATAETHFILKRCLAAWGAPMIIVGVTAAVNIDNYSYNDDNCMLSPVNPYVYYFTFLGPCCVLILVNTAVFVMVVRVLMKPRGATSTSKASIATSNSPTAKKGGGDGFRLDRVTFAQVRGAFTVMTLLGVSWVFGALAVGPARVLFQYVFCVLNSLQGFLVFLVRVLQYPEARAAWIQLVRTGTRKRTRGVNSRAATSSSTNSQARLSLSDGHNHHNHRSTTRSTSDGYDQGRGNVVANGRRHNHHNSRRADLALKDDIPVNMSGKVFWNRVKHHSIPVGTGCSSSSWVYGGSGRGEKKNSPPTTTTIINSNNNHNGNLVAPAIQILTESGAGVDAPIPLSAKRRSAHLSGSKSTAASIPIYNGEPIDTKEGRDTQWLYLPINGGTTTGNGSLEKTAWLLETAPVRLSKVVAVDELPFIEDEAVKTNSEDVGARTSDNIGLECQQMARLRGGRGAAAANATTMATHQSDQGYSSAEPSPTAKRDLPAPQSHDQIVGGREVDEEEQIPFVMRQRSSSDQHNRQQPVEFDVIVADSIISDNSSLSPQSADRSSRGSNS